MAKINSDEVLRCSFCWESQNDVKVLIRGTVPSALICDKCVAVCQEIVEHQERHLNYEPSAPNYIHGQPSDPPSPESILRAREHYRMGKVHLALQEYSTAKEEFKNAFHILRDREIVDDIVACDLPKYRKHN